MEKSLGLRKGWYTGAVYYKYIARNGKIQIHVTAYARHVFLESVQREYGRPSSVAAGAYVSGSELDVLVLCVVACCVMRFGEQCP